MEAVELVMDVEDEFGIAVPDTLLQRVLTVGEFYDAILPIVRATGASDLRARSDLEEYLWSRVKVLAAEPYGVPPAQVTRATRFVEDLGYG